MTLPTPVPQTCATCAHAGVPVDKMGVKGWLGCVYRKSSDYRSPVYPCFFWPARWEGKK